MDIEKILEAKENRVKTQRELINNFKTNLISFTLNIPGEEKTGAAYAKVHQRGICLLEEELKKNKILIVNKFSRDTAAGYEAFLNITGKALTIKRITVAIEDTHPLGRIFDFDILTVNGEQVTREQLGLQERKCLLCSENAKICGRSRKHSALDLRIKIQEIIEGYFSD